MFDFLFKRKHVSERYDLTEEQRDLIRQNFISHNANITWSGERDGNYVIPDGAKAFYGAGIFTFWNTDHVLKMSVAYHRSTNEANDLHCVPLIHVDYGVVTNEILEKIKGELAN